MATELIKDPTQSETTTEMDFGLDPFNRQKSYTGVYAWAQLLNRLIRKRRGTNPSDPAMGIDLDLYRFSDIDQLASGQLAEVIRDQASMYLPNIPIQSIDVSSVYVKGTYVLYINIVLIGSRPDITLAYAQKKKSIISTKIVVGDQSLINTKGSD
jgi:hypothetical protein